MAVGDVIEGLWEDVQGLSADQVTQELMATPQFQLILSEVEARARKAVVEETRLNAFTLFAFAVAGGAIGGSLLRGPWGLAAAGGISVWAAYRLGIFEGVDFSMDDGSLSSFSNTGAPRRVKQIKA